MAKDTRGEADDALSLCSVADDDKSLLEAWRGGDQASGELLFERYYPAMVRFFASKVSGDPADLVQETFLACLDAKMRIRDARSFRPFLFGIAYNRLKLYYERGRKDASAIDYRSHTAADLSPGPSTMMVRGAQERLLLAALRSIPVEHQIVVELYYWEELTSAAVARVLGQPHGTVRSRIRRARQLLLDALQALGRNPSLTPETKSDLDAWAATMAASLRDRDDLDG